MNDAAPNTPIFRRLRLENWRNFTQVDMDLQKRVFLVGPNASGKSNLLDVFRFLNDIVSVGGGFQEAAGPHRGGVTRLRSLSARRNPDIVIEVHIGTESTPNAWEYELRFSQDNRRRPIIKKERVSRAGTELWARPNPEDAKDPERLTQTYLEQINVNREFRDVADFFRSIRYLHVVPQLVREPDRSAGKSNDPYGGDLLEQIARTPEKTRNAWLRRIEGVLRVAVPQTQWNASPQRQVRALAAARRLAERRTVFGWHTAPFGSLMGHVGGLRTVVIGRAGTLAPSGSGHPPASHVRAHAEPDRPSGDPEQALTIYPGRPGYRIGRSFSAGTRT